MPKNELKVGSEVEYTPLVPVPGDGEPQRVAATVKVVHFGNCVDLAFKDASGSKILVGTVDMDGSGRGRTWRWPAEKTAPKPADGE